METTYHAPHLLNLLDRPGFCVQNHIITQVNGHAEALLLSVGTDILSLMVTGREEYLAMNSGCLFLTLDMNGILTDAIVLRDKSGDLVLLDQEEEDAALKAMSLCAAMLRRPLSDALLCAGKLGAPDPQQQLYLSSLERSLNQLHRILANMSDASKNPHIQAQQTWNLSAVFGEIFEKAACYTTQAGVQLRYQGLSQDVFSLADPEALERAVLNLLSNAIKFLPKEGGIIDAGLTQHGNLLRLTIQDNGPGISDEIRSTLFHRHLRQYHIEDSRMGIGLGLLMVRRAAVSHAGTVLVDQPPQGGTRVTMTMVLREDPPDFFRCPTASIDYAGERNHALIELSEVLPSRAYEKT